MCLYPTLITNPKYKKNQKNGGVIPPLNDYRVLKVPIGCKKCMECRKQKARDWTARLMEDIKTNKNGKFVTLTFSDESLIELDKEVNYKYEGYDRDNAIATLAIRRFTQRWAKHWREYNKKNKTDKPRNLRHWFTTELGQNNTERIHIHGIIWTDEPKRLVQTIWGYGNMGWQMTWEQEKNYVNNASISYIVKYTNKVDDKHPNYMPVILTSNGIGAGYEKTQQARNDRINESYRTQSGYEIALPIYYKNKLYTEEEREQLWLDKLDEETRYVNGMKVSVKDGEKKYLDTLKEAQEKNKRLGYGDNKKNWKKQEYEKQLREMKREDRKKKGNN